MDVKCPLSLILNQGTEILCSFSPMGITISIEGLMANADDCLKIHITRVDYIASTKGINNVSLH